MERNFTNENFEHFLKQNADGLRMRPSDKVWQGISAHLNKRKRRIGWILGISLLITSGLGYYFISEQPAGTAAHHQLSPSGSIQGSVNDNKEQVQLTDA